MTLLTIYWIVLSSVFSALFTIILYALPGLIGFGIICALLSSNDPIVLLPIVIILILVGCFYFSVYAQHVIANDPPAIQTPVKLE